MLVGGVWHQCDDGIIRPVIQAAILAHDNSWLKAPFLLDTGADRTVLSADVVAALRLPPIKMAYNAKKTEHAGPKKGRGAFYGRKVDAKNASNRRRREDDKRGVVNHGKSQA